MPRKGSKPRPKPGPLDDVILVSCARCSRPLLGRDQQPVDRYREYPAGHCYGRPHCWRCINHARREPLPPTNRFTTQE